MLPRAVSASVLPDKRSEQFRALSRTFGMPSGGFGRGPRLREGARKRPNVSVLKTAPTYRPSNR
eukprot:7062348-Alexandrium_andersonii.AAC.1